jgi:hypothetical protein
MTERLVNPWLMSANHYGREAAKKNRSPRRGEAFLQHFTVTLVPDGAGCWNDGDDFGTESAGTFQAGTAK